MQTNELHYLTVSAAASLIESGQLSPVELVEAHLERIEQTDERLNSFVTLLADEARSAAADAESAIQGGGYLGPLHGIPIGLKDLYYTKGVRTTVGSKIMGDFIPDYDAAVTERFRNAGAILLGKLQMHEFALGATSENPHHGPARNPWDTTRITGGSSGGSGSAVASGQCMAALGSDTGGSVRIPSSACGIVGLKPTFGRVSRRGVFPLSYSLDTVGPMTRTVTDNAIVMNVIAGYDERDQSCANRPDEDFTRLLGQDISGLRIGVPQDYFYDMIYGEVQAAVQQAARTLESLGRQCRGVLHSRAQRLHKHIRRYPAHGSGGDTPRQPARTPGRLRLRRARTPRRGRYDPGGELHRCAARPHRVQPRHCGGDEDLRHPARAH